MRILFDSKLPRFKTPFGTLIPGQACTLHIHIPSTVQTTDVQCVMNHEDGSHAFNFPFVYKLKKGPYDIFEAKFTVPYTGLFYYFFYITTKTGGFRLFKQGNDTNMEAGDCWQLSCVPEDFTVPDWARGAVIYQVFPDRFAKSGKCNLTGKQLPYTVHADWSEEVQWRPSPSGEVLNNDFYGGNFRGIADRMDYIAGLGASIIYLNPISKSFSSHRYDTGDYKVPDPMLGTEADFKTMCDAAHRRGIRVILDGVYSHTGSDSRYFNRYHSFPEKGAFESKDSPYYSWYTFYDWPRSYNSWWGFDTLPTVNKMSPAFLDYIIRDEDSVVAHWLKLGADGFRLDVADELPDAFIKMLKERIRQIRPDALLIGEVWEDASNKCSYGGRRRYFVDGELDSVMNYPFRSAIINFMRERDSGRALCETVMAIAENYPQPVMQCCMNLLGTHDTPRILTALVDDFEGTREEMANRHLSYSRLTIARERLLMASFLQYTLPGSPSLYYGDEAGMEGCKDPFNRRTFPWGHEDVELQAHYRQLGQLRRQQKALRLGSISFFHAQDQQLGYRRATEDSALLIYVNRNDDPWEIPAGELVFGHNLRTVAPGYLTINPMGFCIVEDPDGR